MEPKRDTRHKLDSSKVADRGWVGSHIDLRYLRLDKKCINRMMHKPYQNDWNTASNQLAFKERGESSTND